MIRKTILNLIIILIVLFTANPLLSGPFLKIERVDSESEFPKIKIYLTVRNGDNTLISGLNEENILVYEDGYRVNYVRVKDLSEADSFLYIVYAVDSSKSISEELLGKIKTEAESLLHSATSNDMIAIYRFNDKVELMNNFTNNRAELIKNLKKINRHGKQTLLYDAVYSSINLLHMSDVSRKAVIIFTDGKDEGSDVNPDDIIKIARETGIPVFCISLNASENTKILARISKLTGGIQVNLGEKSINEVYKLIIGMISRQYAVDYQTILKPDGLKHKMEVRLKYGPVRDRAQKEIVVKKKFGFVHIPTLSEIVLVALVFIFVSLLIYFLIYTTRKLNRVVSAPIQISEKINSISGNQEEQSVNTKLYPNIEAAEPSQDDELIYSKTWLVERDGKEAGKKIPVLHDVFTIGSDPENSIVIQGKNISSKHAKIKKVKKSFYIFDLASDQGTFLNENKLLRPKLLYDWDEIRVGNRIFIFRGSNIA